MNKIDFLQTNSNENYDCVDPISNSGINNFSESKSNINSEINIFSNNNFNSKESEYIILSKSNSEYKISLIIKAENKESFEPINSNSYEGKNSYSVQEFNIIEPSLISSENNNNKSSEKSVKNINNVNIDTSNNLQNNSRQSDNNEVLDSKKENEFVDKKRKRTVFIQNENVNNSSTNTNKNKNKICISIEDSDANSEEESPINKKKGRKDDPDCIRKKNILKFNKYIKVDFNKLLKSKRIRLKFKYIPFAYSSKKNFNEKKMEMSLKEFFSMDFQEFIEKYDIKIKIKDSDRENYEHNKSVLEYLEKKNINFDFLNKTFIQLYEEYLNSEYFEKVINDLKRTENEEYIEKFIFYAKNFIDYLFKKKKNSFY